MKVILKTRVAHLGEEGDIREVAPGYARNFLIPRDMAIMHNRAGLSWIETHRTAIEQRKEARRAEAISIKASLEAEPILLRMPAGEKGRLFGSVTSALIVEALEKRAIHIERKSVEIAGTVIKSLGEHEVTIRLYGGDRATVRVDVQREGGEQVTDEQADKPIANEQADKPIADEQIAEGAAEEQPAEQQLQGVEEQHTSTD